VTTGSGNVQKVAAELGIAYNTARSRLDEMVAALETAASAARPADAPEATAMTTQQEARRGEQAAIMDRLAAGEIDFEGAMRQLKG
jgi:hypothetical protein